MQNWNQEKLKRTKKQVFSKEDQKMTKRKRKEITQIQEFNRINHNNLGFGGKENNFKPNTF